MKITLQNKSSKKLELIKLLKTITGLGLKECKKMAETTPSTFSIHAQDSEMQLLTQQFAALGVRIIFEQESVENILSGNPPTTEQKIKEEPMADELISGNGEYKLFDVELTAIGGNKIEVLKQIKGLSGLSLQECYDIVNRLPATFTMYLPIKKKELIRSKFAKLNAELRFIEDLSNREEVSEPLRTISPLSNSQNNNQQARPKMSLSYKQKQKAKQLLLSNQNLRAGTTKSLIVGIVLAIVWTLFNFLIGILPIKALLIPQGIIIGIVMRKRGKGFTKQFSKRALGITAFSILLAALLYNTITMLIYSSYPSIEGILQFYWFFNGQGIAFTVLSMILAFILGSQKINDTTLARALDKYKNQMTSSGATLSKYKKAKTTDSSKKDEGLFQKESKKDEDLIEKETEQDEMQSNLSIFDKTRDSKKSKSDRDESLKRLFDKRKKNF